MRWNDLIEQIMLNNESKASLDHLYKEACKYRELPSGDWKKTLRGVLYREVKRGRFKKIGLGVFALESYQDETSAYSYALNEKPIKDYIKSVKDYHSSIEGMLLEIGTFFEYITYTSDLDKRFDGKRLRELCGITEIPDFTYPELKVLISKRDAVWFTKASAVISKVYF